MNLQLLNDIKKRNYNLKNIWFFHMINDIEFIDYHTNLKIMYCAIKQLHNNLDMDMIFKNKNSYTKYMEYLRQDY